MAPEKQKPLAEQAASANPSPGNPVPFPPAAQPARPKLPSLPTEVLPTHLADLLRNATEADLQGADFLAEVQKGNAQPANGWMFSPGRLELSALADGRLHSTAEWNGVREKVITRVQAKFIGDSKVLYIWAVSHRDKSAIPVRRNKDGTEPSINLINLLAPAKLTVARGFKERFDVYYVPQDSKLKPGLILDLGAPLERAKLPPKKKKTETAPAPETPPTDSQTSTGNEAK